MTVMMKMIAVSESYLVVGTGIVSVWWASDADDDDENDAARWLDDDDDSMIEW